MGGRRNVRLKKGFANVEKAPFGGEKLRIPTLLYVEKMRTQSRFNVRIAGIYDDVCLLYLCFLGGHAWTRAIACLCARDPQFLIGGIRVQE